MTLDKLTPVEQLELKRCMDALHIINCKPIDVKLLKAELKDDYDPKIIKLAKKLLKG